MADLIWLLAVLVLVVLVANWWKELHNKVDANIPALGSDSIFQSYKTAFRFLTRDAAAIMDEGYYKYRGRVFRIPGFRSWIYVVSGPLVEEMVKAPEEALSFDEASAEFLQLEYTFGPAVRRNRYHRQAVRSSLTRSLNNIYPDVKDEVAHAYQTLIPANTVDWTVIGAFETMMKIVARASNRVFLGKEFCRNDRWLALAMRNTISVVIAAQILILFPTPLRSAVGPYISGVSSVLRQATEIVGPEVERRLEEFKAGRQEHLPNDMLTWLICIAEGSELEKTALACRLLLVNFAAIHTSTISFTHALYHLAANPAFAEPLRDEIETVIEREGWDKISLQKMHKVDSFLRESQRFHGLGAASVIRKVLIPYTFSDGSRVPAGSTVFAAARSVHFDPEVYGNDADKFNPWRFSDKRAAGEGEELKHQMASTAWEYLPFGHGRHACPGRFFATTELKTMLIYTVLNYDVALMPEAEGVRPPDQWFSASSTPNTKAKLRFRKRETKIVTN